MTIIINSQACLTWLNYLNKEQLAADILGPITPNLIKAAKAYDFPNGILAYGAEAKLLGKPGVDLSVQYWAKDFLLQNPLSSPYSKQEGELFCRYAQELNQLLPHVVSHCKLYFEADTFTGPQEAEYAAFYSIAGIAADKLLPQLLAEHKMQDRLAAVQKYRQLATPDMELWLVGFMNSRELRPLRLVFLAQQTTVAKLIKAAKNIFSKRPSDFEQKLLEIDKLKLFNYMLNIDIMPDGSLGKNIGIDLVFRTIQPHEQKEIVQSNNFQLFLQLLQSWQIADARVNNLNSCIQLLKLTAPDLPYQLHSVFSHFKLTWKNEQLAPAKVYLGLKIYKE